MYQESAPADWSRTIRRIARIALHAPVCLLPLDRRPEHARFREEQYQTKRGCRRWQNRLFLASCPVRIFLAQVPAPSSLDVRGRWDLPMFWAYLGVYVVSMVVAMFVVDPTLIQERLRPGPGGQDYATLIVLTPLLLGQCVVAALDVGHYHWSDSVPLALQMVALLPWRGPSRSSCGPSLSIASSRR